MRTRPMPRKAILIFIAFILASSSSLFLFTTRAANPSSGSIGPTIGGTPTTWVGDVTGTGAEGGEEQCIDDGPAKNCDSFALTVTGTQSDWVSKILKVRINWTLQANDYDVYIHKGGLTDPVVGKGPGSSQPNLEEVAFLNPAVDGVGLYTVHVAYAAVAPNSDQYHGTASVIAGVAPAVQGTGLPPRFQNLYPQPSVLSAGKGNDAGEPSIGANWASGRAMFISDLTTFRVTFDDSCPTSPTATWVDKSAPNSQESLDPILFLDHGYKLTGTPEATRTFVSQLSGQDSLTAYSDDDGDTWVPSQGGGIPSGVDHQSIGAGPFHAPLMGTVSPHAVYYCSQDIVAFAFCARSDDGGSTFGPGVPIYSTECVAIHGHTKIAPDGTVYVPNRDCAGNEAAVVSEDNGMTWAIRPIPGTISSSSDPAVAVGRGDVVKSLDGKPIGRLYEAFGGGDNIAGVAVSDDHGVTWKNNFDVGSLIGIKAIAFPTIVAGDDDRATFAFLGSTTAGVPDNRDFAGLWHLYTATTYDGGASWLISDATPNDPIQRNGIHLGGGSPPHRNLLDFIGIDVDKDGRVLVAYADGCTGAACVQGSNSSTGNSYTEEAGIARQSGGRRLFAGHDPADPTLPGAPSLTVGRDGSTARLTWSQSDDGGSAITNYAVLRGTASGAETLLTNVGTATTYVDNTASPAVNYYYKVTATNAIGSSCGSNEVLSVPIGDSQCSGLREVLDPAGDQKSAPGNADLDVLEVRLADYVSGGNKVVFKLKVADLSMLLPNRQWRILWNYPIRAANIAAANFTGTYYVGMNTDDNAVPSFEYGTVTTVEAVPANTSTPHRVGDADSGSIDETAGIISITLSTDKIGGPVAGDVIGALIGRTFSGNGNQTVLSTSAVDTTSRTQQDPYTGNSYRLVGNAPCSAATPTPTPSVTPTPTPSVTPTPTPSVSPTPTPTPTPTPGTEVQFSQSSYPVTEGCVQTSITVTRTGPTDSTSVVDYVVNNATATQRGDFTYASGSLTFGPGETSKTFFVLITEDGYAEGTESATAQLSNPSGATLGSPNAASLQIHDNDSSNLSTNPIDDAATFVCQHYHDFLNRQADADGQTFWTNQITSCGNNASCLDEKRSNVSAAFFLSIEFQNTGYFAFRFYRASFPDSAQRPRGVPRYLEFLRDEQTLQRNVVVGQGNWEAVLEQNKQGFALDWMDRSDFQAEYPLSLTRDEYIDRLFSRSGVTPTAQERNQALQAYDSGGSLKEKRAKGIRAVIDAGSVYNAQYNPAFVLMQYFGYLRRNPNNAPDDSYAGYDFWLKKMNDFSVPGEDVRDANVALAREKRADMVKAFLVSSEYRGRFGSDSSLGQQYGSIALAKPLFEWSHSAIATAVWLVLANV